MAKNQIPDELKKAWAVKKEKPTPMIPTYTLDDPVDDSPLLAIEEEYEDNMTDMLPSHNLVEQRFISKQENNPIALFAKINIGTYKPSKR